MAFPDGWGRKCSIVIDADYVSGTSHANLPVLLTEDILPSEMFDADGSYPALNGGGDIRFSSDSGGSTQLACEVVSFVTDNNPANGTAEIWVNVPTVSGSTDTTIYVWYDKAGETQPAVTDTYGRNAVWSDYFAVLHFEDDYVDSSGNTSFTLSTGSVTYTSGPYYGKAISFPAASGSTRSLSSDDYLPFDSEANITAWVNPLASPPNYSAVLQSRSMEGGSDTDGGKLQYSGSTNGAYVVFGSAPSFVSSSNFNMSANLWRNYAYEHPVGSYKTADFIINGSLFETLSTITVNPALRKLHIGNLVSTGVAISYDEVRAKAGAIDVDRVATEYSNQTSPSAFATAGTPEAIGGGELLNYVGSGGLQSSGSSVIEIGVSHSTSGGTQSGGAATLIASWSYAASGGAQSSGVADVSAVVSPSHEANGGGQSGGSADIQYSAVVQASGGMQSGGTAVVAYQMAQDGDPYYDKVVLLMHMDGANGSTSFVDETGKTITPSGDAQISTAQSVFGGASGVFDGAADYLSVSDNSEFAFGTGDFTIEAKVRPTADGVGYLFGVGAPSPSQGFNFQFRNTANGNVVRFFDHSIPSGVNGTEIVASGVWNDVSLSRASGVLRAFVDGVKCLEIANSSDFTDTTYVMVGANPSPTPDGTSAAFIEELRVTKGVARYVNDYTVPSSAFPDFGQYEIDGTGGVQSGGAAGIVLSWVHVASGGCQSAGAADVEATISGNVHVGEGGAQSGGVAAINVGIVLDASGGAQSGGSAALAVSSVVSGSGGGSAAGVGSVQTTWVLEGSGGGQSAGAADVEFFSGSTSYVYEGTGGGQSGGVAAVLAGWSVSGVGGAQSGGAAVIESAGTYAYDATGGADSGGSAAIQFGPAIVGSGGAQAGGSADVDTNSAFVYEGSGGGVSGGAAALLLAVALVAVGGAVAGGSADVSSNTKSEVFGTGFSIVKREPDGFSTIIRPYPEGG